MLLSSTRYIILSTLLAVSLVAAFIPSPAALGRATSRLILMGDDGTPEEMSLGRVDTLREEGTAFIDVTDATEGGPITRAIHPSILPRRLTHQNLVRKVIKSLHGDLMRRTLKGLTSFHNRHYRSSWGRDSQAFLFHAIQEVIRDWRSKVSLRTFHHPWGQHSIIARFEGLDLPDETIIVGAHLDSSSLVDPIHSLSPGADDDGSGCVTLLEVLRALVQKRYKPRRSVELHWYAATEGGLLGSQAIARAYHADERRIIGMLQLDRTGYFHGDELVGIVVDQTDPDLSSILEDLVDEYLDIPYREGRCGYACSDHASWSREGYRTAFPYEGDLKDRNPFAHTPGDVYATIDFFHALEFAKLAVAFTIELADFGFLEVD